MGVGVGEDVHEAVAVEGVVGDAAVVVVVMVVLVVVKTTKAEAVVVIQVEIGLGRTKTKPAAEIMIEREDTIRR